METRSFRSLANDCRLWFRAAADKSRSRTPVATLARVLSQATCGWVLWSLVTLPPAHGQDTADFFRDRCASCHTIGGGPLTGPDLKDVTKRQDRQWLIDFIMNPQAVIDSGDSYAQKILKESRGVVMAPIAGMTRPQAAKLLDLIDAESQLEESQFKGLQISNAPFTRQDRELGRDYFLGYRRLEGGAPSCVSCHSIRNAPALGGGRLGPELTRVYERLNGRQSLSGWLGMPATETMRPLFKDHPLTSDEIHALVAYFAASAPEDESPTTARQIGFLLLGLVSATALIFACDAIWQFRFRGVRRSLVENSP